MWKIIVGRGDSMMPDISNTAIMFLSDTAQIQIGDIIAYQVGDKRKVHRVIGTLSNDMIVVKPDTHIDVYTYIHTDQIHGVVMYILQLPFI